MSLDEFREAGAFIDEEEPGPPEAGGGAPKSPKKTTRSSRYGSSGGFLGITPVQRFILALMILMMTCLLGTFCLVLSGRVIPPGLY